MGNGVPASEARVAVQPPKPAREPKAETTKPDPHKPLPKFRPRFVVEAVSLLAGGTNEGKVTLSALGQYLKRTNPAFSPSTYGHSGLLDMVKTYDLLNSKQEAGGHWTVGLAVKEKGAE